MRNEAAIKSSEIFRNVAKSTCLGAQFKGGARVIAGLACRRGRRGMEARATDDIFQFDDFRLDRRGLCRRDAGGVFVPVAIGSRALDLLGVLVERPGRRRSNDVRDAKANARTDDHRCGQAPPWPGRLGTDLRGVPRPHCGGARRKVSRGRLSATCTRLPNYGAIYGSASGPPTSDPGPRDVVFTIEGSAKTPPFGGGPRQCPFKRPFSGHSKSASVPIKEG